MSHSNIEELEELLEKCDWIGRTAQEDMGIIEQSYLTDIYLYLYKQYKQALLDINYDSCESVEDKPEWLTR